MGDSTSKDDILENLVTFADKFDERIEFRGEFEDIDSIIARFV